MQGIRRVARGDRGDQLRASALPHEPHERADQQSEGNDELAGHTGHAEYLLRSDRSDVLGARRGSNVDAS